MPAALPESPYRRLSSIVRSSGIAAMCGNLRLTVRAGKALTRVRARSDERRRGWTNWVDRITNIWAWSCRRPITVRSGL